MSQPSQRELSPYEQTIRELSDRLVEAQRPIRILDAIKWGDDVQRQFFASGAKELPQVNSEYYTNRALGFDPVAKRREIHELERDIVSQLGQFNAVGNILRRMCQEYQLVVRMLEARGHEDFSDLSQELYGSANDVFHAGDPRLVDFGDMMGAALANIQESNGHLNEEKNIDAAGAVELLQERLLRVFNQDGETVRVMISDGIVADAAAGTNYIKIRNEARFTERELHLLEVHEGWVHVGTTLNGMRQPVCTFLSKGPPSSTITQEGLALLMEIVAFASYPQRVRKVTNRIRAVALAEGDATFLDVYNFFLEQGYPENESYLNASRVFRGSLPDKGPFTKDVSYSKGFVLVYNFIQLAVRKGLLQRIPLLFAGKVNLEDMRVMSQLLEEGLIEAPKYLPPQFRDLQGLTAWMCYSNFLNQLNLKQIEADYAGIL